MRMLKKTHVTIYILIMLIGAAFFPEQAGGEIIVDAPMGGYFYYGMYSHTGIAASFTLTETCNVSTITLMLRTPSVTSFNTFNFSLQSSLTVPITTFASGDITVRTGATSSAVMNVNQILQAGTYYLVGIVPGYYGSPVTPGDVDGWMLSSGNYNNAVGTVMDGVWFLGGSTPTFVSGYNNGYMYYAPAFSVNGSPVAKPWSFVHMTDTHIGYSENNQNVSRGRLAAAINNILKAEPLPKFIVVTGDIADYGCPDQASTSPSVYKDFVLAVDDALKKNIEVITVPGNHDWRGCPDSGPWGYVNGLAGVSGLTQAVDLINWEEGDLLFIGFNTSGGWPDYPTGRGFTDPQWGAFNSIVAQSAKSKIIFMHHPAVDVGLIETFDDHKEDFLDLCNLNGNSVKLVLSGHTHQAHILDADETPLAVGATTYPQFIQTPSMCKEDGGADIPGYRVINVSGTQVTAQEYVKITDYVKNYKKGENYSPTNLHVYDSSGNHVGLLAGDQVERGLNRSYYFYHHLISTEDGDQVLPEEIIVFDPRDDYLWEVVGNEPGTYRLVLTSNEDGQEIVFEATEIPTSPGAKHVYTVDWSALSAGEEGVTLEIDGDGDGVFERTVIADEDLAAGEFALQTETVIDFEPDVLNLGSRAKVVTVYIELPEGFDVSGINVSSLKLNDSVSALSKPVQIGDYDIDGVPDLMVKFDCAQVAGVVGAGRQVVTITGRLSDETLFAGIDTIRVIGGGSAAVAEPEVESVVPQDSTALKQKKPAPTIEADTADTGASEGFDVKEGVAFMLLDACQTISELGPGNFNSEESAIELTTTIDDMFGMLDDGLYFEALAVLDNDVLQRIDGCANTGEPDENDWIRSTEGQALVYPLVVETLELLESLI